MGNSAGKSVRRSALFYDCFSGICGDMHLGALVDVGVPASLLTTELARLELADEFTLRVEPGEKMGITGTRVSVDLHPNAATPHRHLKDIVGIIDRAGYNESVRGRAVAMFEQVAIAEARIHGKTVDAVHFHEVGATDSIVDMVGAAIGLEHLGVEQVWCGPVELGGGMVRCAHGTFPVPAPATAEILKNVPCHYGRIDSEATTPTGAAILKAGVDSFGHPDGFSVDRIGYGIGHKDFAIPNVLRLMLGTLSSGQPAGQTAEQPVATGTDPDTESGLEIETNVEIEANIDDMNPEAFEPLLQQLFELGARDVFLTPIVMKKSRPATRISVLAEPSAVGILSQALIDGSTTLGVRTHEVTKHMLPRQQRRFETSHGAVNVKLAQRPDGTFRWKIEHDDVIDLARRLGLNYLDLKAQLDAEVRQQLETEG